MPAEWLQAEAPAPPAPTCIDWADEKVRLIIDRLLAGELEYQHYSQTTPDGLGDFIAVTAGQPHAPADIFPRLRWGGRLLFVSPRRRPALRLADAYERYGFIIDRGPAWERPRPKRLRIFRRRVHYFLARKVLLLPPGDTTYRFTHHVELTRWPGAGLPFQSAPLVVRKTIPTEADLIERFHRKFPDAGEALLAKRARKFTERIFPTFLTREAGILMILQEHLPAAYRPRVPRVVGVKKDERGFVRELTMTWLRNGGPRLSQIEFARQAADLLRVLHDVARVIHLDLRMDNMVITTDGVGFVDFGSAVRVDEDLSRNPVLHTLFTDLMRTSQIQQLLNRMTLSGHVTSNVICKSRHKVDKAVDFFYLAMVFNQPNTNPDLAGLIDYDPASRTARQLQQLTSSILRPPNPEQPIFRSAQDILEGVERIARGHSPQVIPA